MKFRLKRDFLLTLSVLERYKGPTPAPQQSFRQPPIRPCRRADRNNREQPYLRLKLREMPDRTRSRQVPGHGRARAGPRSRGRDLSQVPVQQ